MAAEGQSQDARYPFGMDGPFNGLILRHPDTKRVILRYKPNPKQWLTHNCCCDEVFLGGATFGGKSMALLIHAMAHCLRYGAAANVILFRRTYGALEKTLIQECKRYLDGVFGAYKATEYVFEWQNGATMRFAHMENRDDVGKYQGGGYTLLCFDELTQFEQEMYTTLFAWNRTHQNAEIQPQTLSASNPGGIGHRWVYERFIKNGTPYKQLDHRIAAMEVGGVDIPETVISRMFIPAWATDNAAGLEANPGYLPRLKEAMSEARFKALVEGSWEQFEGMAFPEWDEAKHVIEPFDIPPTWKVIRTCDWGYKSPYHVGWLAQDPETRVVYLIDEIYGHRRGEAGAIHGSETLPRDVRSQILSHESANEQTGHYFSPRYGVADPSMWSTRGGEDKVGDLLNDGGVLFEAANRDRVLRAQVMHSVLKSNPATGEPRFRVFKDCKHFIRTLPMLLVDSREPEDVLKGGTVSSSEDHPYDSVGYGLVDLWDKPAPREIAQQELRALEQRYRQPVLV